MTGTRRDVSVDGFNALPEAEATRRLLTCLNVPRWAAEVAGGRRYADYAALAAQAEASAAQLSDAELSAALDGHPGSSGPAPGTTPSSPPGSRRRWTTATRR